MIYMVKKDLDCVQMCDPCSVEMYQKPCYSTNWYCLQTTNYFCLMTLPNSNPLHAHVKSRQRMFFLIPKIFKIQILIGIFGISVNI